MKKWMKILRLSVMVLLIAGTGVLVGFVEAGHSLQKCRQVYITIDYGQADRLVSEADIDSLIRRTSGNLKGKPMNWINTGKIEKEIGNQPYVARVNVFESHDGCVFVEVKQREPILRVINLDLESYYIDASGMMLPLNPEFPARVPVANGSVTQKFIQNPNYRIDVRMLQDQPAADSLLGDLYRLAMFINRDPFFKAQIEQIYVTPEQEFELIPRVGSHVILFGKATQMEEKFRKLFLFYTRGLNNIGWNRYNIINIKYQNQVVCSKI